MFNKKKNVNKMSEEDEKRINNKRSTYKDSISLEEENKLLLLNNEGLANDLEKMKKEKEESEYLRTHKYSFKKKRRGSTTPRIAFKQATDILHDAFIDMPRAAVLTFEAGILPTITDYLELLLYPIYWLLFVFADVENSLKVLLIGLAVMSLYITFGESLNPAIYAVLVDTHRNWIFGFNYDEVTSNFINTTLTGIVGNLINSMDGFGTIVFAGYITTLPIWAMAFTFVFKCIFYNLYMGLISIVWITIIFIITYVNGSLRLSWLLHDAFNALFWNLFILLLSIPRRIFYTIVLIFCLIPGLNVLICNLSYKVRKMYPFDDYFVDCDQIKFKKKF